MNKSDITILVCISILCTISLWMPIVSAQVENKDVPIVGVTPTIDTSNYIINISNELCEKPIAEYRAEAIREIQTQKEILKNEVNNYLKFQRLLILLGVAVASFLGTTLSNLISNTIFTRK